MIQRMRSSVAVVYDQVSALAPADDMEADHRREVLRWLGSTDDVYRRVKPATPPRHLVSYVVPVDPTDGSVLLVDHVNAGLWLPPGGPPIRRASIRISCDSAPRSGKAGPTAAR